jgi:hypothetical protein
LDFSEFSPSPIGRGGGEGRITWETATAICDGDTLLVNALIERHVWVGVSIHFKNKNYQFVFTNFAMENNKKNY